MGVWERSPAGREAALSEPGLIAGYREALKDFRPEDVIGSPYCVHEYAVDARFGGPDALAATRARLASRGLALILDFVPNHVATDHRWVTTNPEFFLAGTEEELARRPHEFVRTKAGVLANGRDPYNPPWRDVLQLNSFAPLLRDAAADTLKAIAAQADGVRCDMAMLMCNEVFHRTWGDRAGRAPEDDYWPTVIAQVKHTHPDFAFIAEVYWDMEYALQQQGFDHCYDKRLYDRLVAEPGPAVREHLLADLGYQDGLIRFIENHDEPRAAARFPAEHARAAAVAFSTLPGARLYHDGQLSGWRTRVPVQLGRGPVEPVDTDVRDFYHRLLRAVRDMKLGAGEWSLCECTGWPDNDSHRHLVAWAWTSAGGRHLVIVNLSRAPAQAHVRLPWAGSAWEVHDELTGERFTRAGAELADGGLYVALAPWASNILELIACAPA
jgi:Alpha amylase, catalytic domain